MRCSWLISSDSGFDSSWVYQNIRSEEMASWVWLLIGLFAGCMIGIVIVALCTVARDADERSEGVVVIENEYE